MYSLAFVHRTNPLRHEKTGHERLLEEVVVGLEPLDNQKQMRES